MWCIHYVLSHAWSHHNNPFINTQKFSSDEEFSSGLSGSLEVEVSSRGHGPHSDQNQFASKPLLPWLTTLVIRG